MAVVKDLSLTLKAKLFRGLADPSRLAILESLRTGEKTVSEVVAGTGLSQPNASGHLICLKDCGLVRSRQEGRRVYYALADPRMEDVLCGIEALLADVTERVATCAHYADCQQKTTHGLSAGSGKAASAASACLCTGMIIPAHVLTMAPLPSENRLPRPGEFTQ